MEILTTTRINVALGNKPIENVKECKYLGVTFSKQNRFK